jgi:hypothetical protein
MGMSHLMLELEDGTKQTVHRGDYEAHRPKPDRRQLELPARGEK